MTHHRAKEFDRWCDERWALRRTALETKPGGLVEHKTWLGVLPATNTGIVAQIIAEVGRDDDHLGPVGSAVALEGEQLLIRAVAEHRVVADLNSRAVQQSSEGLVVLYAIAKRLRVAEDRDLQRV